MEEKKGYFADCYVLCDKRTNEFIQSFLDTFVPNRYETASEYEVPLYANSPKFEFKTAVELIDYLCINPNEAHSIYWKNTNEEDIKGAMCFFTNDGNVIIGIYCDTKYPDTTIENKVLADLKQFCKNSNGYISYEEPTTHDTAEFLEFVKNANAQ